MDNILLTGGSGFLGRGYMRHSSYNENQFIVYSRDEYKQDLCKRRFPTAQYFIGDITDPMRLAHIMEGVDVVIHMAAMKYIPEAEFNVEECIRINVLGSKNVLEAAHQAGVRRVVCISTDKAASPINVYGMTKALMERMCGEYARFSNTIYTCVRYGNVVGSTGSVIPAFQRQLEEQRKLQITDPNMTRFWISIEEAVKLIELALHVQTGQIVIPKARAMALSELAEVIANGAPVEATGLRPGERRHELLINQEESVRAIDCMDHYVLNPVGSQPTHDPFIITSQTPHHFVTPDEMKRMIACAS